MSTVLTLLVAFALAAVTQGRKTAEYKVNADYAKATMFMGSISKSFPKNIIGEGPPGVKMPMMQMPSRCEPSMMRWVSEVCICADAKMVSEPQVQQLQPVNKEAFVFPSMNEEPPSLVIAHNDAQACLGPSPSTEEVRLINELMVALKIVVQRRSKEDFNQLRSPFEVKVFPDEGKSSVGVNQYGWGTDYSEKCEIGVVFHSGGTPAYLRGLFGDMSGVAKPTMTLRDVDGEIIFHTELDIRVLGLRSASVVKCVKRDGVLKKVEVLTGSVVAAPPSALYKVTVDMVEKNVAIDNVINVPATSVRALKQVDKCNVMFAPLSDGLGTAVLVPMDQRPPAAYFIHNFCENSTVQKVLYEGDHPLNGYSIWDFELSPDHLWINLFSVRPDQGYAGGFAIDPSLVYTEASVATAVSSQAVSAVKVSRSNFELKNPASALSLSHTPGTNTVVACTLSGFVYQGVGALSTGGMQTSDALGGIDLSSVQLGKPQECFVCEVGDSDCWELSLPGQVSSNAYIWSLESCGPYTFAASLDLSHQLASFFKMEYAQELQDAELYERWLFEDVISIFVSVLFEDPLITSSDFGFDLWYIENKDMARLGKRSFAPVTQDGFRRVDEYGNENFYNPFFPVSDGVRNMVCHPLANPSPKLLVASAVYGPGQTSQTFELNLGTPRLTRSPTTSPTKMPSTYCNDKKCSRDCSGICGWSTKFMQCMMGSYTTPEEYEEGAGCPPIDNKPCTDACNPSDPLSNYAVFESIDSLDDCASRCLKNSECTGFEHKVLRNRGSKIKCMLKRFGRVAAGGTFPKPSINYYEKCCSPSAP